jgi:hypothetical protein
MNDSFQWPACGSTDIQHIVDSLLVSVSLSDETVCIPKWRLNYLVKNSE